MPKAASSRVAFLATLCLFAIPGPVASHADALSQFVNARFLAAVALAALPILILLGGSAIVGTSKIIHRRRSQ